MTPVFLPQAVWLYKKLVKRRAHSRLEAAWSALSQGHGDPLSLPPFHPPQLRAWGSQGCGPEGGLPWGPKKGGCWGESVSLLGGPGK